MSFIKIENISKTFNKLQVLKNVSLSIEEGEFITLLGPSGCGKSTLLRAIAGLNDIDSGTITVGGRDITHLPPKKRNVGMVFQSYALFPNMTVYENIAFGLKMEGMTKQEIRRRVEEMIGLIDLKGKEKNYPNQLSGGQQQRVALARSLVKQPAVMLLDEPLSALDAKIRRTLRNEIRQIQRRLKMTTIFVTHDQEEALTVSDRIFVMNQGMIEQEGRPHEIYTSPKTEFVARFIGSYNIWSREDLVRGKFQGVPQEGELFAVRPEIIRMEFNANNEQTQKPDDDWMTTTGTVMQSSVLGNIVRFEVTAGGVNICIDTLHDGIVQHIQPGMFVRIYVPKKECKVLQRSS